MSGHSHYATIKRQKESKDIQKGKIFSKFAREIAIAVREGGGSDPEFNYKLRMVIDKARSFNMPKENIERAIRSAQGKQETFETLTYEGFGPAGVGVLVEVATDNRNRTSQEIKNLFDRGGGSLTGPGSVAFNFENKGLIVIKKENNPEEQILKLIDLGVEEVEETPTEIEVYTSPDNLREMRTKLEEAGFSLISYDLILKPKTLQVITDPKEAAKVLAFLEQLENHDDVQKVFTNVDISDEIIDHKL